MSLSARGILRHPPLVCTVSVGIVENLKFLRYHPNKERSWDKGSSHPVRSSDCPSFSSPPRFVNVNSYKGFCRFSAFSSVVLFFSILTALCFPASTAACLCSLHSPPLHFFSFHYHTVLILFPNLYLSLFSLSFSLPLIALSNALCSFYLQTSFFYILIFFKPIPFPFSLLFSLY